MKNKYLHTGIFEGMEGLILESRGGTKNTNNERNIDYKLLLLYILERLKKEKAQNIKIFVASRNSNYKSLEDRRIIIDDESLFNFDNIDLDDFIPKLNKAIKQSGQAPDTKGGNSTKKLFFYQEVKNLSLYEKQNTKALFIKEHFLKVINNFKYLYDVKPEKNEINELQEELYTLLKKEYKNYKWYKEYKFDENRGERFDIYGTFDKHHIIIELDPHRADSIAKKFVSRIAMMKSENLTYVVFLYKGTEHMNINESNKFLSYCEEIIEMFNRYKIDTNKEFISYCHYTK